MPLFMDRHELEGATPEEVAQAHLMDVEIQGQYGVRYITYWFNYDEQRAFCLVDAPDAEVAQEVHAEAHGLLPNRIIPVDEQEVERFLGRTPAGWSEDGVVGSTFRTIMFTDLADSTRLTQELGDQEAMEVLRMHDRVVGESLAASGGRQIKHTGDGIMASFDSVSQAIEAGVGAQRGFAEHQADRHPISVRIGLAAGEPISEGDDLFGAAVQLAARICDAAEPDEVWVSNAVRELAIGKGYAFENCGPVSLKGFPEPVRLAKVLWDTSES